VGLVEFQRLQETALALVHFSFEVQVSAVDAVAEEGASFEGPEDRQV
jgi:hypothetical protein